MEITPMDSTESSNSNPIVSKFEKDGFVVLRDLIPLDLLGEWQAVLDQNPLSTLLEEQFRQGHTRFPEECRILQETNHHQTTTSRDYSMGQGVKHGFSEIVHRSPGRYEVSLLNIQPLLPTLESSLNKLYTLLQDANIPALLQQSSWNDIRVSNVSFVMATPGAASQGWHADGGHVNVQQHLPCHCFNVFVALHDILDMDLGPTQLRPGTHVHTRNLGPMLLAAHCRKELKPPVAPLLRAGDALVFDYRLLHRGLANTTAERTRCVLVITLSQPWFRDCLNFPKRQLYPEDWGKQDQDGDCNDSDHDVIVGGGEDPDNK